MLVADRRLKRQTPLCSANDAEPTTQGLVLPITDLIFDIPLIVLSIVVVSRQRFHRATI